MKKFFILISIFTIGIISAQKISGKVVISNSGEEMGRYVGETSTKYHVDTQDDYWIPKKGNKVVLYSAANGKGILVAKNIGFINVRQTKSATSPIIGKMVSEEGSAPDVYECLGYSEGWFKTKVNGKIGYVKSEYVKWDSISTY